MTGRLVCALRGCRFAIRHGVPVLVTANVERRAADTAARFDQQWQRWRGLHGFYQRQFLDWIAPVAPESFAGRVVLEGGCGKGRHSAVVADFRPRALVSIDLGESAIIAFENTRHLVNVHVAMGDVMQPPVLPVFDLAFSVGVLHHLPNPAAGFATLASRVRQRGCVVVWVYGRENNEWIVRYVNPVRAAVTSRMAPGALRLLSALPATLLWALLRGVYRGATGGWRGRLPYAGYFASLHGFPWHEIHTIVFDQLVTPVAHYLPEAEVRGWLSSGFIDTTLRWKGEYSWTAVGTVNRSELHENAAAAASGDGRA
jgi:SAM-dependent methyltransferase